MKYLRIHNIGTHINLIKNESARKNFLKFSERRSFFVRCRRTYVLNKINQIYPKLQENHNFMTKLLKSSFRFKIFKGRKEL